MPLPVIGGVISAASGLGLQAALIFSFVAGALRVLTLLGASVLTFEGLNQLAPYLQDAVGTISTGGTGQAGSPLSQAIASLMAILKVQHCISVLTGAMVTRATFRAGLIFGTRT